jgi:hypothetical protein
MQAAARGRGEAPRANSHPAFVKCGAFFARFGAKKQRRVKKTVIFVQTCK